MGTEPKIIVWDTATMRTIKVLRGFHRRAVTLLVRLGVRVKTEEPIVVRKWFVMFVFRIPSYIVFALLSSALSLP